MLNNCRNCQRAFPAEGPSRICEACQAEVQHDEDLVVDYLRNHNPSNVEEIHRATGVSEDRVVEMLRNGRVVPACPGMDFTYPCARCGGPIHFDRYCNRCTRALAAALNYENRCKKCGMPTANEKYCSACTRQLNGSIGDSPMPSFTRERFKDDGS